MVSNKTTKKAAVKSTVKKSASAPKGKAVKGKAVKGKKVNAGASASGRRLYFGNDGDKINSAAVKRVLSNDKTIEFKELADGKKAADKIRRARVADKSRRVGGCGDLDKLYSYYFGLARIFGGIVAASPRIREDHKDVFDVVIGVSFMDIENCCMICKEMEKIKDDLKDPEKLKRFVSLYTAMSDKLDQIAGRLENIVLTVVDEDGAD